MTPEGATLTANTVVGVLRGLATFEQLVEIGPDGFLCPSVEIFDSPRFSWRGLLIDVCRHWQPMEVVKRNLDGMAAVKLNVLHFHATEDQGFRVESKLYPRLHEYGSDGNYYTQDEIKEIVEYARNRGIRVVPEFDVPGHSASWLVGYPELAAGPGPFEIIRRWGVFDPCMDPTKEEVYTFLDNFIGEMVGLFPDECLHIGGDEVNGKLWNANPHIQDFIKKHGMKDNHELQTYFNKRLCQIVQKHGKKMVGWDEILQPDLPKECIVQSWRGAESLARAAVSGHQCLLSNGYYLDHIRSAEYHYVNDPLAKAKDLTAEQQARILGGEACMWAEYVTPEIIDSRIWPRMAPIAERLWSSAEVDDIDDMYRRMDLTGKQLHRLGLRHEANYIPMLERIAGSSDIESIKILADVVEPAQYYGRSGKYGYTQFTPMNRLIDAARPESLLAREFNQLVRNAAKCAVTREKVRKQLVTWRDNHARLEKLQSSSSLVADAMEMSRQLKTLATVGLEALDYLESDSENTAGWVADKKALLDQIKKTRREVVVAIRSGILQLVQDVEDKTQR